MTERQGVRLQSEISPVRLRIRAPICSTLERSHRGLVALLGKQMVGNGTKVRILHAPPIKTYLLFFFGGVV